MGCGGNYKHLALEYLKEQGVTAENDYPRYEERQRTCRRDSFNDHSAIIPTYTDVGGCETCMKSAVYNYGAVLTSFKVSEEIYSYYGGIYESCNKISGGHAVAVVGYGQENGKDYWLIKNSWGPNWGERGYFRMRRNVCSIGQEAYYIPTVYTF